MKTLQKSGKLLSPTQNPQPTIDNPQFTIEMREPTKDLAIADADALLSQYGFELRGYTAQELVNLWLKNYEANWIRLAVIEALYQGRYKAISVEQILAVWLRRGQPIIRFNHDFERLICRRLSQNSTIPFNTNLTYPSQEPSLPSLTNRAADITHEPRIAEPEEVEPVSTDKQELPPPVTTNFEELTETPLELDEQLPEVLPDNDSNPTYDADWSRCEVNKPPIHQFTPPPDASGFYLKLKEVVQQQEETRPNVATPVTNKAETQPRRSDLDKN